MRHRQRGHGPEPQNFVYERAKDGEPLSVTVFGVTSLQHRAQLLVDLCLNLRMSKRDDEIQPRVCIYVRGCTVGREGAGGVVPLVCARGKLQSSSARLQWSQIPR